MTFSSVSSQRNLPLTEGEQKAQLILASFRSPFELVSSLAMGDLLYKIVPKSFYFEWLSFIIPRDSGIQGKPRNEFNDFCLSVNTLINYFIKSKQTLVSLRVGLVRFSFLYFSFI